MIRILHSVSNMDRAGIETMLMNYYRNINREDIQFDFLCNKSKKGAYDEEIIKMGGKIYRTPGLNPMKFFKYRKYMQNLFNNHPEYKIIHVHNGAFGVYALYCAKLANIPIRIFHGHNSGFPIDLKLLLKLFCKKNIKNNITDRYACGKMAAKFYFGQDTVNSKNYQLINNAIDIDNFKYNEEIRKKIREKYNLENKTIIGHIGRFSSIKNHKFLIKVFLRYHKKNDNSVLVLIGDGKLLNKIKRRVKRLKLENNVLFLGNLNNTYEWYQAFDLFILPSINEGLPVVAIEAQASGLPCLFSEGVPRESDITGNCEFLNLTDGDAYWASIIEEKLNNNIRKDETRKITQSGYNIKKEAKKLEQNYKKLYEGLIK